MHHLSPDRLHNLLASSEAAGLSADARERLRWIAAYASGGSSVSELCAQFNIARSTFHRWIKRFDADNLSTLEEHAHTPIHTRTSSIDQTTADLIRQYREHSPLMGKETISELLMHEHALEVSASSVGRIIERDGLYFAATPLHWKKRTQYMSSHQKVSPKEQSTETARSQMSNIRNTIEEKTEISHLTSDISQSCGCFWCSFWKSHGRGMRRTFGLASIAINIAIVSVYLATAFWEQKGAETLSANIQPHQTGIVSNLDAPRFNEQ